MRQDVERLSARDAERLLRFLADAESLAGEEPFTPPLLAELGRLVEADWVSYHEQDRVHRRGLLDVERPGDEGWPPAEFAAGGELDYWTQIADVHPVCARSRDEGVATAMVSDFVRPRELRRSFFYKAWFAPSGVEDELSLALPSPPWHTRTFLFERTRADFTERERLVLDLVQPHLDRLWRTARVDRLLAAALEALERKPGGAREADETHDRGILLVRPDGRIEHASPAAQDLIAAYFGERDRVELPTQLARWFESGETTFLLRRDDRSLGVERSGPALLLEERQATHALTPRE